MLDIFWGTLWLSWIGIFFVLESIALRREADGDTLSENTRWLLVRKYVRWPSLTVWVGFAVWFAQHIWFG